jgi:plasmid stabilization system protein ParE
MPRLIWSSSALTDVRRAYQFLFKKNPIAARQAVGAIRQSVKTLSRHPEIGRPVDAIEPEYREWPIAFGGSGYIALYHFDGSDVVIVAVRHQRESGFSV